MSWSRLAIVLVAAGAIAAFFWFGLDSWLDVGGIKHQRFALSELWRQEPLRTTLAFVALNVVALALSLPGAVLGFGLAAGAIFGPVWGTAITLISVVLGDSLAFLTARYVLRGWVERRFATQARRANQRVERDGAFYLLALRLMAVMPYFVVNLTMGMTRMPLRIFAPTSFVGLLPVTFLYVRAGDQLSSIEQASDIYSPALLVTLAALGLLPLAARLAVRHLESRKR